MKSEKRLVVNTKKYWFRLAMTSPGFSVKTESIQDGNSNLQLYCTCNISSFVPNWSAFPPTSKTVNNSRGSEEELQMKFHGV